MISSSSWRSTQLWATLENMHDGSAEALKAGIIMSLPDIEAVLASGDTMPASFTLHDAGHAWRVAERMVEIASPGTLLQLSAYEIAALLLSAYLHDVGMTPPVAKTEGVLTFLLSADPDALSEEEQNDLQEWLDEQPKEFVPPLAMGSPTVEDMRQARELLAGYIRARHNDWSAAWIRENLSDFGKQCYSGWIDDLILLCQSHGWGIDALKDSRFDPRFVGQPSSVLHLRYCACLLRMADVLEFDPERTPKILSTHRDIDDRSAIFWHKDHEVSLTLDGGAISIHATPPDARTHHAITLMIEQINQELLICRRLADEEHIDRMDEKRLPHRWHLETTVHEKITLRDNAYEYVDGMFRPDPMRVLELIGGVELYGSPLAAVRELVQNAFDAVRDQIARQRLARNHPEDPDLHEHIAATHLVSLRLICSNDKLVLVCEDTGCGMSREIITSRFLIGGRAGNKDTRALERECERHGFSTERTARFGIGVLSYFLLASEVTIRTRRSIEAGDPDGTGWTFATHGLEDFGELSRCQGAPVGTRVELALSRDVVGDKPDEFANQLYDYIDTSIRRVPCEFTFTAEGFSSLSISSKQGWLDRGTEVKSSLIDQMTAWRVSPSIPAEFLPNDDREMLERQFEHREAVRRSARDALSLRTYEGELPDGLGSYRLFFGFFELGELSSLAYMKVRDPNGARLRLGFIDNWHGLRPIGTTTMSWNGVHIEVGAAGVPARRSLDRANFVIEIDWSSNRAGRLAVDRNSFVMDSLAVRALATVYKKVEHLLREFADEDRESPFALLNSRLAQIDPGRISSPTWPGRDHIDDRRPGWSMIPVRAPAVVTPGLGGVDLRWRGDPVRQLARFAMGGKSDVRTGVLQWYDSKTGPSALGVANDNLGRWRLIPVWEEIEPRPQDAYPDLGFLADFPPEWNDLAGALVGGASNAVQLWNRDHPLLCALDPESWEWVRRAAGFSDPLEIADDLMRHDGRAAAWILHSLNREQFEIWRGLGDRAPAFRSDLWNRIDGLGAERPILTWSEGQTKLGIVTASDWELHKDDAGRREFVSRLGLPGVGWWLTDGNRVLT
ncbi:MAG TPA: hypothetical protein VID51_08555 [Solirubrobacterales bacterium]